jgi:hypothetical protein
MGTSCTLRTDCPAGLDCVAGTCGFRQYRGNGFYICFLEGRWDLGTHITDESCPEIYPFAGQGS